MQCCAVSTVLTPRGTGSRWESLSRCTADAGSAGAAACQPHVSPRASGGRPSMRHHRLVASVSKLRQPRSSCPAAGALVGLLAAQAGGDDELLLGGGPLPGGVPPRPQLRQPVPVLRLLRRLRRAMICYRESFSRGCAGFVVALLTNRVNSGHSLCQPHSILPADWFDNMLIAQAIVMSVATSLPAAAAAAS
jgi:hypothetical protein